LSAFAAEGFKRNDTGYHVALIDLIVVADRVSLSASRLPTGRNAPTGGRMLSDELGYPQIAALLILLQRGLEELHSQGNTRRLLQRGAVEAGRDYYPVVATVHAAWVASLALLIPSNAPVHLGPLLAFLLLQPLRYWIIGSLGGYWTHRIITLSDAPIVATGPYRLLRHPNYAVTLAETLLLPLAFGQLALGLIFTAIWGAVLFYKIQLEDRALIARRANATGIS
jgi:methyltransferase